MNAIKNHKLNLQKHSMRASTFVLLVLLAVAMPSKAQYDYQIVNPPGAVFSQTFGINESGKVLGGATDGVNDFSFVYNLKKDTYDALDNVFNGLDINNSGAMAGNVDDECTIRDKNGNLTTVVPPSLTPGSGCFLRGINSRGQVSGFQIDALGNWLGFTHDPKKGTFAEFLPSPQTFAHAINAHGQVAGSEFLFPDDAFPGSVSGRYGYVRDKDGVVTYFSINQALPGSTRARGISESGLVAGFYLDPLSFEFKSYVTDLDVNGSFQDIALDENQIVFQKPCNPDTPPPPSADYELFTSMTASQVRNDGVVVGSCSDVYFNSMTGDQVDYGYGFVATPQK